MITTDMHIFKKINSCIRKCKQFTSGIRYNTDEGGKIMNCTTKNKGKGQQKNRIASSNIKDETFTDMFLKDMREQLRKINSCVG